MVAGRLRCLGSVQHLKGRFGEGYRLEMRLAAHEDGGAEEGELAGEEGGQAAGGGGCRLVAAEAAAGRSGWASGEEGDSRSGAGTGPGSAFSGDSYCTSASGAGGAAAGAPAAAGAAAQRQGGGGSPAQQRSPPRQALSRHRHRHRHHHRHGAGHEHAPHEVHLRMFCRTDAALQFVNSACPAAQLLEREPCRLVGGPAGCSCGCRCCRDCQARAGPQACMHDRWLTRVWWPCCPPADC
jgi:hypothetical protein